MSDLHPLQELPLGCELVDASIIYLAFSIVPTFKLFLVKLVFIGSLTANHDIPNPQAGPPTSNWQPILSTLATAS